MISFHLFNIMLTLCGFMIMSGLVFWIGRAMGGTATLAQSQLAMSWFMLITSLLTPFALLAMPDHFRNPPSDPDIPIDMSDANLTIMMIVSAHGDVAVFQHHCRSSRLPFRLACRRCDTGDPDRYGYLVDHRRRLNTGTPHEVLQCMMLKPSGMISRSCRGR